MILLDYISTKQFSKLHNISKERVSQLVKKNKIIPPPVKFGNSFVFSKDAVIIRKKNGRPRKNENNTTK